MARPQALRSRYYGSAPSSHCRPLPAILLEVYALPAGTLPPELDHAIEDLLMPGFRERVFTAYLANMPDEGTLPS